MSAVNIKYAQTWIGLDPNPQSKSRLETMLGSASNKDTLEGLFPQNEKERLEFGTAGLRAAFGPGPLRMNDVTVMQTAQGLLRQLIHDFGEDPVKNRGIVIGYDHRASPEWGLSSKGFALAAASVFLSAGIDRIFLMDDFCPTPFVPFAIQQHKCVAGFMMTASHNPKQDAGFKVYWANACQLVSPLDDLVTAKILGNLDLDPKAVDWLKKGPDAIMKACAKESSSSPGGLVQNTLEAYVKECKSRLCRFEANNRAFDGEKICYTAMHGVGQFAAERLFREFGLPPFVPVPQQAKPEYDFPSVPFPNPEEKGALDLATHCADTNGCRLVLANDPDADRLAVAEKDTKSGKWLVLSGDEIAMLLAWWELEMFKTRKSTTTSSSKPPAMVVSAVSSGFVGAMGAKNGCKVFETLTGFKWIGTKAQELREKHGFNVLFSYEEAIGFCVGDVICDKDGINASAVFAEMYVHLVTKEKTSIAAKLESLRQEYGYFMTHNGYIKTANSTSTFEAIRNHGRYAFIVGSNPNKRFKVTRVRDLSKSNYIDTAEENLQPQLPHSSLMVTLYLEPLPPLAASYEIRVTLRASGTEPKLKYYVEASGPNRQITIQMAADVVQSAVIEDLLSNRASPGGGGGKL